MKRPHPKPLIAVLLSFVFPGIGHLYAGGTVFAFLTMVSTVLLSNVVIALMVFWDGAPYNIIIPALLSVTFFLLVVVSAAKRAKEYHTLRERPQRPRSVIMYVAAAAVFLTIEIFFVPFFGSYRTFRIPTGSMEPTLVPGDRFLIDEGAYRHSSPQRGDLVMFMYPADHTVLHLKRCAAVGGDTLQLIQKKLIINGVEANLPAKYVDPNIDSRRDNFGPYVVPNGFYFMLGDSRDDSFDSRFWGPVSRDLILGKAIRITFTSDISRVGLALK